MQRIKTILGLVFVAAVVVGVHSFESNDLEIASGEPKYDAAAQITSACEIHLTGNTTQ